ncbi:MAG: AsmA family protein [Rhizobiaceae bacterium]
MARLFVAIGGLIVLALTAALVVPHFIDWTNYRAAFEREASRILGRHVEVRGSASARLLPFPSVTFTDVLVTDQDGGTAMTVERFSMDAELAPFLSGEVLIFDMRLERPEVSVTIDEDGVLDWAVRPETQIDPRSISVESLSVTNGRVLVRNLAGGREHVFAGINADLNARTLAGPWRASGQMTVDGVATAVTVNTGTAEPGAPLRVRLRAEPTHYPLTLDMEGFASAGEEGALNYEGQFRLAAQAETADGAQGAAPPHRISGSFTADHQTLRSEEFRLETGPLDDPYIAEGSAMVSLGAAPRFHITAEGVQLRVDEATGGAASLEDRLAALRRFLDQVPKPTIPGTVELDLPAVIAGDTTIREVGLRAEPSEAGWRIAALNATLPGRTALEASGELSVGEELGFAGSLLLAINQPSGFAAWLSRDVDEAIRRLPAAGFSADVELGERRQTFSDMELVLGGSVFRGEIDNRQPDGERRSMALRLEGEGLDVDGMSAFASLFVSGQGQTRLDDHDLDFDIRADAVRMAGVTAGAVDTAFRLREGLIEVDRLRISGLEGADIEASGQARDLTGTPRGALEARISADDLSGLLRLAGDRLADNWLLNQMLRRIESYPGLARDADLVVSASTSAGDNGALALSGSLEGQIGGNEIELRGSSPDWNHTLAASALRANLSASAQDAVDLFALVGLPGELPGFAGPARAELTLDGRLDVGAATRLVMSGEETRANFEGEARLQGNRFAAKGRGRLQSADLGPWLMTAAVPLLAFDVYLPSELQAELDYTDGLLVLTELQGELAGTRLRGELNAENRDGLPHLTGEAHLSAFDAVLLTEMLFGAEARETNGAAWPNAPFKQRVSVPFTADVDLSVEQLSLGAAAQLEDARMGVRLARDGIAIANLDAQAYGGRLTGLGELRNDTGEGLFSAQMRLDDAAAGQLLPQGAVSGRAGLSASLSSTGKSFDGMVSALAGSGTMRMSELNIEGVASDALPALLAVADAIGRDVDEQIVADFAPRIVQDGHVEAGDIEFAFSVAGGALRVPPIQIEAQGLRISTELGLDLATRVAHADANVQYDAGEDALVGSDPSVRLVARGPLDDMQVSVDTDPLARFLTQRSLEREQRRVEDMQAGLLEQQRIRREVRYFAALRQDRLDREAERREAEEEAQRIMEEEIRRRAEAEERRQIDAARRQAEEEARRVEDEEARRRAQEEAEIRLEQERQRVEQARRRAEEEARAEEERRRQLETDIETILRLQESRVDGFDPPLPETGSQGQGMVSGGSPVFRPETLSPQGLSGGN